VKTQTAAWPKAHISLNIHITRLHEYSLRQLNAVWILIKMYKAVKTVKPLAAARPKAHISLNIHITQLHEYSLRQLNAVWILIKTYKAVKTVKHLAAAGPNHGSAQIFMRMTWITHRYEYSLESLEMQPSTQSTALIPTTKLTTTMTNWKSNTIPTQNWS